MLHDARSRPDVSVVLSAYRAEHLIHDAIRRILDIQDVSLELVLVDDGSDDATLTEMRSAVGEDERATVIAIDGNGGLGAARERAFRAAKGRFIWNVDVDDEWPDDALAVLLATAEGADLVLAGATRRSASGTETPMPAPEVTGVTDGPAALAMLLDGRITGHLWNKLIATELLSEGVYTPAMIHTDLIMVAAILGRARAVKVEPRSVYTYIETQGSNIRSGRPRGDSLSAAWTAVSAAVAEHAPQLALTGPYRSFHERTIVLSKLRDAVRSDYDALERPRRFAAARREVTLRGILDVAARHPRDALLLCTAVVAPPLFRAVMAR